MRAVLFANGELHEDISPSALLHSDDFIISVDGGLRHIKKLGLSPDLIIGDLDSIDRNAIAGLQQLGIEILRFPPAKDETDLELALQIVKERGFDQCLLIAALGGRVDQILANIWLLAEWNAPEFIVSCDDGLERIDLVISEHFVRGTPGDIVSLIPFGGPVSGIKTHGLEYPLNNETLHPHESRGLSNVLIGKEAEISIESGKLLCILRRESDFGKDEA